MSIEQQRKAIDANLDVYRNRLDVIPDDRFDVTPPGGGWSYAEVYSHIMQATLGSSIAAEKCTLSSCKPSAKGRSIIGFFVLTFNRLPPFPVKTPKAIATVNPVKKITKEEARNLLVKCRKRIGAISGILRDSLPNRRIKHARLGMLNAQQWLNLFLSI